MIRLVAHLVTGHSRAMPPDVTLPLTIDLADESRTQAFARALAPRVGAGDTLALSGPIGAGKSVFARALIRARLNAWGLDEDIPSPTFTLVQTYEAGPLEIWHSDLYRLSESDDALELGLLEAFEDSLCLIEWPDRLGRDLPRTALRLAFQDGASDTARTLTLSSPAPGWGKRIAATLKDWRTTGD